MTPLPTLFGSFAWTDLALSSRAAFVAIQFAFLVGLSSFFVRRLIYTRIGGPEAIEIRSWPRLIVCSLACNAVFLAAHHLYLAFGPSPQNKLAFVGLFILATLVAWVPVAVLGVLVDGGRVIRVRTSRFKPEHSPLLIDLTANEGRHAQLIPRGALFAYQFLMLFACFSTYGGPVFGAGS